MRYPEEFRRKVLDLVAVKSMDVVYDVVV